MSESKRGRSCFRICHLLFDASSALHSRREPCTNRVKRLEFLDKHQGKHRYSAVGMDAAGRERGMQTPTVKSDEWLQRLVAAVCSWILKKLASSQDVLLSFSIFRKAAAYGLAPNCRHTVLQALQSPEKISSSFEELEYYVSDGAQELLMHAALHGLVSESPKLHPRTSIKLPNLGRILLQVPVKNSALYQESVAAALAKRLKADFLVIDDALLSSVAKAAFGSNLDKPATPEDFGKLVNFVLSIWFSGTHLLAVLLAKCQWN